LDESGGGSCSFALVFALQRRLERGGGESRILIPSYKSHCAVLRCESRIRWGRKHFWEHASFGSTSAGGRMQCECPVSSTSTVRIAMEGIFAACLLLQCTVLYLKVLELKVESGVRRTHAMDTRACYFVPALCECECECECEFICDDGVSFLCLRLLLRCWLRLQLELRLWRLRVGTATATAAADCQSLYHGIAGATVAIERCERRERSTKYERKTGSADGIFQRQATQPSPLAAFQRSSVPVNSASGRVFQCVPVIQCFVVQWSSDPVLQ
jgi:hypothetical protein